MTLQRTWAEMEQDAAIHMKEATGAAWERILRRTGLLWPWRHSMSKPRKPVGAASQLLSVNTWREFIMSHVVLGVS